MVRPLLYLLVVFFVLAPGLRAQEDTLVFPGADTEEDYVERNDESEPVPFLPVGTVSDSFPLRRIPDSLVQALRDRDEFWYANANIPKKRRAGRGGDFSVMSQPWFQTLLWIITIGGFAGFLIWYLAGTQIGLFRRKQILVDRPSAEGDLSERDLFALEYAREIDRAVTQGNFRLATRLLFLKLLKELAERNIIDYRQGRTNFDYLLQLRPTAYYDDFFRITRNYEYCWYGKFDVDAEKFARIRQDFDRFETRF
ncbi:MAG TPA: DUF4129 domain-containing protein [Chitinophagaceae bacterium]|nr:DUF4129 domain-containing protein [Chitinophagaceae bacterium]